MDEDNVLVENFGLIENQLVALLLRTIVTDVNDNFQNLLSRSVTRVR